MALTDKCSEETPLPNHFTDDEVGSPDPAPPRTSFSPQPTDAPALSLHQNTPTPEEASVSDGSVSSAVGKEHAPIEGYWDPRLGLLSSYEDIQDLISLSTDNSSEASNHAQSSDGSDKWFDAVECQKCEARKAHYETASVAIQQLQENIDRLAELVAKLGEHCNEHGDMDGPIEQEDRDASSGPIYPKGPSVDTASSKQRDGDNAAAKTFVK
tara:strand:- start:227 stop:862 length:636 start_codon:yes stop_codon:yes gene_type:complete